MKPLKARVFKYLIFEGAADHSVCNLPRGARFLKIGAQGQNIMLWALVDPSVRTEQYEFVLKGTGHPAEDIVGNGYTFLDTVFQGPDVWHIWYRKKGE